MVLEMSKLSSLSWRLIGDDWVVFNEGCGETIIADPLTAGLLMALESNKFDHFGLVEQVANDLQISDHEQLQTLLQEKIESLLKMGWIESEP